MRERGDSNAGDDSAESLRRHGGGSVRRGTDEYAAAANLLRKVVGFNIMDSAVFLLLASLGYIDGGTAPIVGDQGFDPLYINPIPSGLVLTGIVVSVSITAFSLALIQRIYRRYGTIELRELLERARKEDD